jgi:hypothetical protein
MTAFKHSLRKSECLFFGGAIRASFAGWKPSVNYSNRQGGAGRKAQYIFDRQNVNN